MSADESVNHAQAVTSRPVARRLPLWVRQLGWPGLLGLASLLACAGFIFGVLPQRQAALDQAESDVRRLRHGLIARVTGVTGATEQGVADRAQVDAGQAWRELWQSLPDDRQRLSRQARVLAAAREVGLDITAVQWQGEPVRWTGDVSRGGAATPAAGLWRHRMTVPVQAPYPAVRSWLDRLKREPGLTVDALDIQRSDLTSDQVQAQLVISLWWRQPATRQPAEAP